jgi:hypothetical protein
MPRRHTRKMKGGFLDSLSTTLSSWGSTISQSASDAYNKAKNATTSAYNSATTTAPTTPSYPPMTTSTYGGRKRSRKMRGGNVASNASPISGIKTAQPHNWVGGKTKKYRKH